MGSKERSVKSIWKQNVILHLSLRCSQSVQWEKRVFVAFLVWIWAVWPLTVRLDSSCDKEESADDIRAIDALAFPLKSSTCFLLISEHMRFSSRSGTSPSSSIVAFSHSIQALTGTETDRDRRWSTSIGFIEPRFGIDDDDDGNSFLRQLHYLTLPCCSYTQFQVICRQSPQLVSWNILVIYLHPRSLTLSLSIVVSGKSRNRVEIVFWSNPVTPSSETISSIVSVAAQVSVDHSDGWRQLTIFWMWTDGNYFSKSICHSWSVSIFNSIVPIFTLMCSRDF